MGMDLRNECRDMSKVSLLQSAHGRARRGWARERAIPAAEHFRRNFSGLLAGAGEATASCAS